MYKYKGKYYRTYKAVTEAVLEDKPKLSDDELSDYVDWHVEEVDKEDVDGPIEDEDEDDGWEVEEEDDDDEYWDEDDELEEF